MRGSAGEAPGWETLAVSADGLPDGGPPRVFGEGVLTLAISADGVRAYVGTHEVPLSDLEVLASPGHLDVTARPGGRGGEREMAMRLLRRLSWAKVP